MARVSGSVESGRLVHVDESQIRGHVDEVVRASVEETLNGLLDAEADQLCGANRYERSANRVDTRAGSYDRKLQTKAGEVKLKVPRLRSLPFETQIIERYKRRETLVEEALTPVMADALQHVRVFDQSSRNRTFYAIMIGNQLTRCRPVNRPAIDKAFSYARLLIDI